MKYFNLGLAFFLALGAVGTLLPVLPTTPFLLLSFFFFTRSSRRWQQWFVRTKIYNKYLKTYFSRPQQAVFTLKQDISLPKCKPGLKQNVASSKQAKKLPFAALL
ncbi:MAG: DUF454 domain-containing protein [Firmicutes bacterium]|nr:DUF454 domain-containing protein [Bacillota bacterium]